MARKGSPGRGFISYFTRHGTIANLVMVFLIVAGIAASLRIRAQYFPDVVVSEITVSVGWDGAGAEDVDRAIVQVLEPSLLAVDGVNRVVSRAREGSATIDLEFEPGVDLARAAEDVQAAVDAVNNLPDDADEPSVRRDAWRDGVTDVVITGPVGVDQLARFADEFVARLFAAGVTRTTIQGLAATETVVEVPSVDLMRHDITMAEIAAAIAAEVSAAPAGDVGDGSARLRAGSERRSAADIEAIVLRSDAAGTNLRIGDIATIRQEGVDRTRAAFVGDNPAMTVRVQRTPEGDAIRIQAAVREVAAEFQKSLPPGVTVDLVRARADQITERLWLLLDNAATGLVLVLGLLFLFLNARTAFWVAMGIPVAILAAIAVMYVSGLTLNMMSLFALILIMGVIVDDSIVVSEHAEYRFSNLGEDPVTASENAARRMSLPVLASTLTTVIAFFGLVTIGGRFGDFIADIPFTVIAVMLASLVECFLILPNHMSHALMSARAAAWYDWPSRQTSRFIAWFKERAMKPFMRIVIAARYPVLALATVALASQVALFLRGDVQFRFFNAPEQSSVSGSFSMLPGAGRDDTVAMMRELQRATEAVAAAYEAEHGISPVTFVMSEVGGTSGRGLASAETKDADLLGSISIELISPDLRPYSSFAFVAALEEEVRAHPLMEELSFRGGRFGPGGDTLSVDLSGSSAEGLKAAAEALKTALRVYPEVSALEDTLAYDKEELVLDLTQQGQALGFNIDALGRSLRERLNGIEAATYPDGPRSAAIRVELPAGELTADFLETTQMRAGPGLYVPLADIVTVERRAGFSTVRRENGLRIVTVTGDIAEDNPARANEIQRVLRDEIIPRIEEDHGVATRLSGRAADERRFLGGAAEGLILALVGIYLCLAWIFESWSRPVIVMSVIPFGMTGAIFGHWVWGVPMSMFSIVGMIGMIGIIINDSIVLISTVDEYSKKRGVIPAIVDGAADRLRAVFLTTATTVLGLAPLLYEESSQAEFLKPTVVTLVFGLGLGMFIVLLIVPAVLGVQADVGRMMKGLRRGLTRGPRGLIGGAALAIAALFAATILPTLVAGQVPGWMAGLLPVLEGGQTPAALAVFVAGAAVVCLAAFAIGAYVMRMRTARG